MKAEKITRYPAKYLVHQTKISLGISTQNCVLPSKRCLLFCIEPPPLLVVGLDTSILCVTSVCIVHIWCCCFYMLSQSQVSKRVTRLRSFCYYSLVTGRFSTCNILSGNLSVSSSKSWRHIWPCTFRLEVLITNDAAVSSHLFFWNFASRKSIWIFTARNRRILNWYSQD